MIDKLTIAVASLEEMAAFYAGVLGMEFAAVEVAGHELRSGRYGDLELLLCPRALAGVDADSNTVQVRFLVPNVTAAMEAGLSAGGSLLNEVAELGGVFHGALRDPDGNSVELRQTSNPINQESSHAHP